MKKYSLGFAFDASGKYVVLIQKQRPTWQAGQWNGVGGHVEEGETFWQCMVREFREETTVDTYESDWSPLGVISGSGFEVHVFALFNDSIYKAQTNTDESVSVVKVSNLGAVKTISNLSWLIPAALDNQKNPINRLFLSAQYVA